ncbi:MAG: hypothetical protein VR72_10430 [Clostridiaceae bacterium BRH_c20a]|nr:MAG: hypothetical protein VR72_10430 [Clostridiaceae bacterium BRH_c20a]
MGKKIFICIFMLSTLFVFAACSKVIDNPQNSNKDNLTGVGNKIIKLNFIKVPDLMIINTPESISELEEVSQPANVIRTRIREKGEISDEDQRELDEIEKQVQELMLRRKIIADKNAISKLFKTISVLDAELIEHDKLPKPSQEMVFSYDLIDNADMGISGNEYEKYFRYFIVDRNKYLIIPIMSEDKKKMFWGRANISEDVFNQFKQLNQSGMIDKELMRKMLNIE